MKTKETMNYAIISDSEYWKPSKLLRWAEKLVTIDENSGIIKTVLQQLYTSNLGNREWRDIPTEKTS